MPESLTPETMEGVLSGQVVRLCAAPPAIMTDRAELMSAIMAAPDERVPMLRAVVNAVLSVTIGAPPGPPLALPLDPSSPRR